ncbi:MAG: long-chain fatty acid--CoA ligase [Alphaproteobacteria bacterium]|nr:long-chain fatty acid--CoA ligase [Alphaproteobacteria bacterium]
MWNHRVGSTPDGDAMTFRSRGAWSTYTWRDADERVRRIANALLAFGLEPEQRCCILSRTRVEWILCDMAILSAAGATTTIYPSSTPAECAYIIDHCGAVLVFAEDDSQVAKLQGVRDRIPNVKRVVVIDGHPSSDGWVQTLAMLEVEGREHALAHPGALAEASEALTPDSLATLIYTSGTTGEPKGVMLSHDAWVYEAEAMDMLGVMSPADKQYLFLPLAHVFAKVMQVAFIRLGIPTVVDGDTDTLLDHLAEQRPTWMGAVPRIFEKAYNAILRGVEESSPAKRRVFHWALGVGREVSRIRQQGREPTGLLKLKHAMADRLVFSAIKAKFGGRIRFFISGGAPLSREIAEFFHACDLLVLEGYGLTESAAASCVNEPDSFRFGTVGKPVPGCELKLAEDGEILLRSRGVMQGYYNDPEATAEALTPDGWLKTGDIGVLLPSGHLQITDRKKALIITAGGKNVAPAHFESLLKARCPYVGHVVMHGDARPYCTALVTLDPETVGAWAAREGLSARPEDWPKLDVLRALVQCHVDEVNRQLPSYETVKKFAILDEDFTLENGLLTPSLKVKRKVVEARYQRILDAFYEGSLEELEA